jgi:hypothetical protein
VNGRGFLETQSNPGTISTARPLGLAAMLGPFIRLNLHVKSSTAVGALGGTQEIREQRIRGIDRPLGAKADIAADPSLTISQYTSLRTRPRSTYQPTWAASLLHLSPARAPRAMRLCDEVLDLDVLPELGGPKGPTRSGGHRGLFVSMSLQAAKTPARCRRNGDS